MGKNIVTRNGKDYQLITIGIDLTNTILGLMECNPSLISNPHGAKANELAKKWNNVFIDNYVSSKEGGN